MQRSKVRRRSETAAALARNGDMAAAFAQLDGNRVKLGAKSPLRTATSASTRGHRAQASGRSFQDAIMASLTVDELAGRCVVSEGNPHVRGAPGRMFPDKPARVDVNVLTDNIAIAFDCKTVTGRAEYSLAALLGHERDHKRAVDQIEYLLNFRKQGGIAFLLLYESKLNRAWLVFQLQSLLNGESVKLRTLERAARGVPARVLDHQPMIEPRTLVPVWPILAAALKHGRRLLPITSPFRDTQ